MENVSIIAQLKVKKPNDLFGTIVIRGFYNRKPVTCKSTGHKIHIDHWDPESRSVNSYAPNYKLINTCIDKRLGEIKAELMKKEIAGHRINSNIIYRAIKGITDKDFI